MAAPTAFSAERDGSVGSWRGFRLGLWQREINVRDFIQQNYEPYDGDESFLTPATERTKAIWNSLTELFKEERKRGFSTSPRFPVPLTLTQPATSIAQ
jgi:formate C-acetyltransferase